MKSDGGHFLRSSASRARTPGSAEGRADGKQRTLLRQLSIKFGELPSEIRARAATATEVDVDLWLERLLTADTLDAVFGRD